jgi:transcriptional regulator with XRE-family HTH domain
MNDLQLLIEIGARIKKIRAAKNLSQNDLAIMCNFEKASMSRIEAGKTNVTLLTLQKISSALKVEVSDLLTDGVANSPHE